MGNFFMGRLKKNDPTIMPTLGLATQIGSTSSKMEPVSSWMLGHSSPYSFNVAQHVDCLPIANLALLSIS
jgi:hypothetical protein